MALLNKKWKHLPIKNVIIHDGLWKKRIEVNFNISLMYQYEQFIKTGTLKNFKNVIDKNCNEYYGLFFSDASLYKWIEAVCFYLISNTNSDLKNKVEYVVSLIETVQEPDGYVNTYYQCVEPAKKFTNFGIGHELYCAGHLIEAAIAHFILTNSIRFLTVAIKFADYIDSKIGPGKLEVTTGHQGLEIALIKLYKTTEEKRYLKLAEYLINNRGKTSRFIWECNHLDAIGGKLGKPGQTNRKHFCHNQGYDGRYVQDHLPVREQEKIVGHAVRALYMYCGIADLYIETEEDVLLTTLSKMWEHVTKKVMYITGGVGASRDNEGISDDFKLPNINICAEPCASVGMVLWNFRMMNITHDSKFADVLERVLYNGFLVSISLDGTKYFYNNSLESSGNENREGWYECPCCLPNISRVFSVFGKYIYSCTADEVIINLFVNSSFRHKINSKNLYISVETQYPWDGRVECMNKSAEPVRFTLSVRIPSWCSHYSVLINEKKIDVNLVSGYAKIKKKWEPGDILVINLDMPVTYIRAHPLIINNFGKIAIMRGPLVYCLEELDHEVPVNQIVLQENNTLTPRFVPDVLGGVVIIEGKALAPDMSCWNDALYLPEDKYMEVKIKAVPYYSWNNRGSGSMVVWIRSMKC